MLKLDKIKKVYCPESENSVVALEEISLTFRDQEFVSILGQSGCGKTTLLNIIGGLDQYTSGNLIINGKSTKDYKAKDWDTYRNHTIGFVFQSYNLIPHLTILENVELALTIGGVKDKKEKAKKALIKVGLENKLNKKPTELSGGQNQRVSIARALVNEPDILLCDEPTGALDTETSVQVMNILKEISKEKLVIMVTHNPELAKKYSDRIVKMLDGKVIDDSNPVSEEAVLEVKEDTRKFSKKYSSMGLKTAFKLSANNLLSKKRRTIITSLASSIGIMGVAVILSISNGMSAYIDNTMAESTSFNYLTISSTYMDTSSILQGGGPNMEEISLIQYPENTTGVIPYEQSTRIKTTKQDLSEDYINYLEEKISPLCIDISYSYSVTLHALTVSGSEYQSVSTNSWNEALSNTEYVTDKYDVLAHEEGTSYIPKEMNELALVVDSYNRLSTLVLDNLGIDYNSNLDTIPYEEILGKTFTIVLNNGWYIPDVVGSTTVYREASSGNYATVVADSENTITCKITSILREKKDASASWLSTGINYSPKLTKAVLEANKTSDVALAQANSTDINVLTGNPFSNGNTMMGGQTYESVLSYLGYFQKPSSITIYPKDIDSKEKVMILLDSWNNVKSEEEQVKYTDMSATITSMLGSIVNVITAVLMFFSIISLVISCILIAIVIYASVIERTKEIGVLRSLGASKKDVARIFESEAIIIGIMSGLIAIVVAMLVNSIINIILKATVEVSGIAALSFKTAIILVLLSAGLLLLSSLIPASIASKKEPAVALRTE